MLRCDRCSSVLSALQALWMRWMAGVEERHRTVLRRCDGATEGAGLLRECLACVTPRVTANQGAEAQPSFTHAAMCRPVAL